MARICPTFLLLSVPDALLHSVAPASGILARDFYKNCPVVAPISPASPAMRSLSLIACLSLAQRIAGQQIYDIWYEILTVFKTVVLILNPLSSPGKLLGIRRIYLRIFPHLPPLTLSHLEPSGKQTLSSMTAKSTRLLQASVAL